MHQPTIESVTTVRVNYSETDQMGVVYHARYVVWLDIARTEHLRQAGYSYRELEEQGIRLVVTDLQVRYRNAARFDDVVRIRCRLRAVASRRVVFGYAVELAEGGTPLVDAETTLICLDARRRPARLPDPLLAALRRSLPPEPA
ncbi:MAG: acyl-CoA thioesterase [Gemmatimonadetes bacterium]|nr:acyl-CoA thioesterase [Gemmatimonadota bacterium]MBK6778914.1 acyl-CoA thioesterase [Gemmatimonadota bacterium]MBK7348775.1 acyl-CoA thioesterase [Gemmatimonadota bacterium]MBK7714340.1 acyl-CoA thioesterase [Gemmatimonadota bacterium]MBK7783404.1 acyl-CoA thioesterase [Gemmatimonadota bacterium]